MLGDEAGELLLHEDVVAGADQDVLVEFFTAGDLHKRIGRAALFGLVAERDAVAVLAGVRLDERDDVVLG